MAAGQQMPIYIVGGFVRDLLLGQPAQDLDLVVEGDAIELAHAISAQQGGRVTVHSHFKTAQWYPPRGPGIPEFVDLISARSEIYKHPAALPTVKPGSLIDDLRRRDFTLNTLAMRLDGDHFGEITDAMNGLEDLQHGIVRTLHSSSFEDDPTRMFRMVRYEIRYGFKVAPETLALVQGGLLQINRLSAERVRHELDLILEEENVHSILKRLVKLGILSGVHPLLEWNQLIQNRVARGLTAARKIDHPPSRRMLVWSLWLMGVPPAGQVSIEKRLHFDSSLRDMIQEASILFTRVDTLAGKKPSQCVAVLDKIHLRAIQTVFVALPDGSTRQILDSYLKSWRGIKPKTTGHDLKKHGLPPGPEYKSILRKLRAAWLDGEVKSFRQELLLLDKLTQKKS
jgi:tRNA nucleotidyltransferase (CCA-adding enzyme)